MVGQTLAHYRVVEKIGAGGMGEVYRATDTRLGREVALKVLPEAFARDPERLARFQREALLLASLNHPHIAAIYGVEEADDTRFLVLELVEGQTLAERLTRGPVPVEEALGLCRQIAEALEAAHEKGILHRDLKPENVKLTPDSQVKVLDFGLAKALADETLAAPDPSKSPTASYGSSLAGVILGTAAYMSPEQARGKPVDKRTDIWAFGCVLYEALTGRQAFSGETISDTIAATLDREPDWGALPDHIPTSILALLRRCLQKDSARRLHDIADARIEIEEALAGPAPGAARALATPQPGWRRAFPWSIAWGIGVVTAVAFFHPWHPASTPPPSVKRFAVTLPAAEQLIPFGSAVVALSLDGTRLVYAARGGNTTQLYLRLLDQLEAKPLPGTEGADGPFFSPDGQWVGFFAGGKLKKVSLEAGTTLTLCDAGSSRGASWGPDDTIVFSTWPGANLLRVSAAGGIPEPLTTLDTRLSEVGHRHPQFLPGAQAVLFTILSGQLHKKIAVLSLASREKKILLDGGSHARYLPSGHLLFARSGSLFAVGFDLARLEVTGKPVPLVEGVITSRLTAAAQFSVSGEGSLVYVPGTEASKRSLVWVDRQGRESLLPLEPRPYDSLRLSPDGRQLALTLGEEDAWDLWVDDLGRGTLTRLTFQRIFTTGVWTPDGKRVTFSSPAGGLAWKLADGSGGEEKLPGTDAFPFTFPVSWSPDGRVLAFAVNSPKTSFDIWILPREGEGWGQPQPFLETPFGETSPQFSPDGRWLAYASNESGRLEVYVQPFPGPGGRWQISTDGGIEPIWARSAHELFYLSLSADKIKMMSVGLEPGPAFKASKPRLLFEGRYSATPPMLSLYDVSPDGQRFLLMKESAPEAAPTQVNVVLNWSEELKRRAPATK